MFENFPYTNFHDLNLDWLIKKVKEAYSPDNPPENVVISVNGETGEVVLYKNAVVQLPAVDETTWAIFRKSDNKDEGIQFIKGQKAQRIDGTNRYDIYDAGNPPAYPVTSVNGETGAVVSVKSVNGATGVVTLYPNAQIAFPNVEETTWNMYRGTGENGVITGIQFKTGDKAERIDDGNRYAIYDAGNPPPYPVTSVGTLTGAVAILDTTVVVDGDTQKLKIAFPVTTVDGATGAVTTWGANGNAMLKPPVSAQGDNWGFNRDIPSGNIGIKFVYDDVNDEAAGYIVFNDGTNPEVSLKILTPADIPSSSGVVSFNGQTGAVTCTGADLAVSGDDATKVNVAIGNNATGVTTVGNLIAEDYNSGHTYFKGVYCKKAGVLYKANATTTGTWDSTKWDAVDNVAADLCDKVNENIIVANPEYQTFATQNYSAGDYILISGVLYKAKTNISNLDTFTSSNVEAVTIGGELDALSEQIGNFDYTNPQSISVTSSTVTIIQQKSKRITPKLALIDYVFEKSGTISGYTNIGTVNGINVVNGSPITVYDSDQSRSVKGNATIDNNGIYCANAISGGDANTYHVYAFVETN